MRERASVAAALVLTWGLTQTAAAELVELKQLEQRALERHALAQAGAAHERAAAANVREAESAYRPRIGLNVDSNLAPGRRIIDVREAQTPEQILARETASVYQVQGVAALGSGSNRAFVPQWRSTANVTIGANLYDFGRTSAAVAASRAKLRSSKVENEQTRAQVVASVRLAYLSWLSAHQLRRLSESASVDGLRRSERVNALVQEGARPRAELAPVEADRLLSQLEFERASGDLEGARLMLEQSVGEPLSESAEPDLRVLDVQPEAVPRSSTDPQLRMLVHQRAALEATARMQRRAGLPVISASAAAGIGVQTPVDESDFKALPSYVVGLGLSVPLWDGGGSRAAADATEAQADALRLRLESASSEREHEQKRAELDAAYALRRQKTAEQLVTVCTTRVTDVEAGYELGAMQFDQVQQARSLLRRAETELVMAKVARAEAILRFLP
jgi:outer membrane protein